MNFSRKMITGYIAGGIIVLLIVPSFIYIITSLIDNIFRIEIIRHSTLRWILICIFTFLGITYGIWSIITQNVIGKGGPLELGNIEISPKTKNLIVSGPYKNTRNPMLFGTFLAYLGFALFLNSITSVALVFVLFIFMLSVVVKMEEKRLSNDFGTQYKQYRKRVSVFFPWFQKK